MLWWRYEKVDLVTALSPEDCIARLRAGTQSEWRLFGTAAVVASIGENSFRIRVPRRWVKIQTVLYGRLDGDRNGTRVRCRIGVEHLVLALASGWSLFAALVLAQEILSGRGTLDNIVWITVGGLTVTVGVVISRVLWNDDAFLLDFVRHELAAQEAPSSLQKV